MVVLDFTGFYKSNSRVLPALSSANAAAAS
jgi:hypothetical protein